MVLELDHVLCFVEPDGAWRDRARSAGWVLDEGIEHVGQGTRNRRIFWQEHYLELIWLSSRAQAMNNPVRLDRRADHRITGASPFGVVLRGTLPAEERAHFWSYEPPYAPGSQLWIHRSNELEPEKPLLVILEASLEARERMRPRTRLAKSPELLTHARAGALRRVILETTSPAIEWLGNVEPRVVQIQSSREHMSVLVGESSAPIHELTSELTIVG